MKPTRVLVVGGGSIGERHVRCFLATQRVEVALCDPQPEIRKQLAKAYELVSTHADLDEAIDAFSPEVAVVATPATLHIPMARQLVEAGSHVLVEKPLSIGLDGVRELRQSASKHGAVVAVAYVSRADPLLADMRDAIQSGRFGRIVELVAVSGQNFPTYRPAYREIYYARRESGGGAIQDALTHVIDTGQWLAGPIDSLAADAAHQVLDGVDVEDTVHLIARQGDVLSSYSLNQHQAPNESTITVICSEGTARIERHRNRWRWQAQPERPWQEVTSAPLERDTLFIRQAEAFLDVVLGKRENLCSLDDGVAALRASLAALRSLHERRWVDVREFDVPDAGEMNPRAATLNPQAATLKPDTVSLTPNASPTAPELFGLAGRTAIVTGAAGHLGSSLAQALAEAGASVAVTSRDLHRARRCAESLPRIHGAKHFAVALDQLAPDSIDAAFSSCVDRFGRVDILVDNANEGSTCDWTNIDADTFNRQLSNLTGYFLLARLVRDDAARRGAPASIILLGSMYGQVASYPDTYAGVSPASSVAYHALKGGVIQVTRHLAAYWARDNVRVNCLSPGPFPGPHAPAGLVERLKEKSPMGRMGEPQELKGALLFLASDASSYMTGQNLVIDGGWTAW